MPGYFYVLGENEKRKITEAKGSFCHPGMLIVYYKTKGKACLSSNYSHDLLSAERFLCATKSSPIFFDL